MAIYNTIYAGRGGGVHPSGTYSISANGTYDVTSYASADVSVPGIIPSGTSVITANGIYDVSNYASASVSVTAPAVNIEALSITENGTYTASGSVDGFSPVTVSVSGGGTDSRFKQLIERKIVDVSDSTLSYIGSYAFYSVQSLHTIDAQNASYVGLAAFSNCANLSSINLPNILSVGSSGFTSCWKLTSVFLPKVSTLYPYALQYCDELVTISLPSATSIGNYAFRADVKLVSLYLMGSSIPTISSNTFSSTPIAGYTTATGGVYGSIFVPASLYNNYVSATYWSLISARIVSV